MKKNAVGVLPLLALTALVPRADAETFPVVGARALAMGGAQVAAAQGPTAAYWNPSAMALGAPAGSFLYSAGTRDPESLAERLDNLAATRALQPDILSRPADAALAAGLLSAIAAEPDPIVGTRAAGAFFGGGMYGLSLYRLTFASGEPLVDLAHTEFSDNPATGIPYNRSALLLRSLRMDDYVLSMAFDFGDPTVLVGGSVRYTHGTTHISGPSLFAFPSFGATDVIGAADDGVEQSNSEWSFDVGAMLSPGAGLRFGVIGKYLGAPEFEVAGGTRIKIDPRWRLGASITPAPGLTLAGDLDLSESAPGGLGNNERDVAIGVEYFLPGPKLALRGGYRDAVSGPNDQAFSAGLGFSGSGFSIDGGVGWSPRTHATTLAVEISFAKNKSE